MKSCLVGSKPGLNLCTLRSQMFSCSWNMGGGWPACLPACLPLENSYGG